MPSSSFVEIGLDVEAEVEVGVEVGGEVNKANLNISCS